MQQKWETALAVWKQQYPDDPEPFITCTHRSHEDQDKLYAKGRTAPGPKVTWAKAGQSKHNQKPSPAFDIAFLKKGSKRECDWSLAPFKKFAAIIKPLGVVWGGDWQGSKNDSPHFEQK